MARPECGNRDGEKIVCPFYVSYTENEIRCEPHVPEASAMILRYRQNEDCRKQRWLFCEKEYKRCEHYRTLMHFKWEDE